MLILAVVLCALIAGCMPGGVIARAHKPPSSGVGQRKSPAGSRPNIVFVLTDDLSTDLLRFMPNVRSMGAAGSTFTQHFVVDSLCCPSRAAIFTGEYPHDNGVFTNTGGDGGFAAYVQHGNEQKSFAMALQQSGYRTGFMGKYLNGYRPTNGPAPGWDQWYGVGNGYAEYNYRMNENGKVIKHGHRPQDYLTDVLSRKAVGFIDNAARDDQPFMLQISTFAPHQPNTPAPRYANRFATLKAPHSKSYNKLPAHAATWLREFPALTRQNGKHIDEVYRQRARAVLAVDDLVAQVRTELKRQGIARNTYLVFTSDNGYHAGQHRLLVGKQTAFDTDIRVPLLVTGPGVPQGRTVNALTTSIDFCPTFEEIAGARGGGLVDGVSMLRLWHGHRPANWQKAVLIEHHGGPMDTRDPDYQSSQHGNPPTYSAIRTTRSLYVEYVDGEREYYDRSKDPYELNNLAGSVPAARLAPLKKALTGLKNCHSTKACQRAARM